MRTLGQGHDAFLQIDPWAVSGGKGWGFMAAEYEAILIQGDI
jgi:hypothetical protein